MDISSFIAPRTFIIPPHFVAKDAEGVYLIPGDYEGASGNVRMRSTNQHRDNIRHWKDETPAFREVFQNMFDGIVAAHGHRFDGLLITESGGNTYFHSNGRLFGAVIVNDAKKCISFVNFSPSVKSVAQVIQFGASEKDNELNQVGQHGEGLKRAMLWFTVHGYTNESFFPICTDMRVELMKMVFKMKRDEHDGSEDLCVSISHIGPNTNEIKYFPFSKPLPNAFCVSLMNQRKGVPAFDIRRFIVNDFTLLRSRRLLPNGRSYDPTDFGYLIPREPGKLYVYNFFVTSDKRMKFGYNIFLDYITRDRDDVKTKSIIKCVASIWDRLLESNEWRVHAKTFCDAVLFSGRPDSDFRSDPFIEDLILDYISLGSCRKLHNILCPVNKIAITAAELHDNEHFDESVFEVFTDHQMKVLERAQGPILARLKQISDDELKVAHQTPLQFRSIGMPVVLLTKTSNAFPLHYYIISVGDKHVLYVNADWLLDGRTSLSGADAITFWKCILFEVMPRFFNRKFRAACDKQGVIDEIVKAQNALRPEPIVIDAVVGSKRLRQGEPAHEAKTDDDEDEYEPYEGPQLFVLKSKK
jgi:hypothetical protein